MNILFALHLNWGLSHCGCLKADQLAKDNGHTVFHAFTGREGSLAEQLQKERQIDVLFVSLSPKDICEYISLARKLYPEIWIIGQDPGWRLGREIPYEVFYEAGLSEVVGLGDSFVVEAMQRLIDKQK